MKILVSTFPFAKLNILPFEILSSLNVDFVVNPLNKKLTEKELILLIQDVDILIAGTERISKKVIDAAPKLKLIARVGIGLDNIDLYYAKSKGIKITYTPDAPAPAVAELTMGLILTCLRKIHLVNDDMHQGQWNRYFGKRINHVKVGLIGAGRIGTRVINHLEGFGVKEIYINDINPSRVKTKIKLNWVDKSYIYSNCDLISLHLPLSSETIGMIQYNELLTFKSDAVLINTSRGGIINEFDLYNHLKLNPSFTAAIDVFSIEPYTGNLSELRNCILTSHMGSMSEDCRAQMEIEACKEAEFFIKKEPLRNLIPDFI